MIFALSVKDRKVKQLSSKWFGRFALAHTLMFVTSSSYALDIDCSSGKLIQEKADIVLKGLGLLPEKLTSEAIGPILFKAKEANDVVGELQTICDLVKPKNVADAYFFALNKLSKGLPMAPYISYQIKAGAAILKEAEKIASNVGIENFYDNSGLTTTFEIRLSNKEKKYLWTSVKYYQPFEIHKKIRQATVVYKTALSDGESAPLATCTNDLCDRLRTASSQSLLPSIYEISVGESLIDFPQITKAYLKIEWANGQWSMVPLRGDSVNGITSGVTARGFKLDFFENGPWITLAK
jgi:hypothetical protein